MTDTKNKLVVAREESWGSYKIKIKRYKLPVIKEIIQRNIIYRTGNIEYFIVILYNV